MSDLKTYNHLFYQNQVLESTNSAKHIVPLINEWFLPKSIIDVGCGVGSWLNIWKNCKNVIEVKGVDAHFVDKSLFLIDDLNEFIEADLNKNLPHLKKFDVAMCLEVAEHLDEKRAVSFIKDLTDLSDVIVFSAAIPGQEGTNHVNEQFLKYWVEKFNKYDYKCYDVIRPLIWEVETISWWFRQNIVLFIKEGATLEIDLSNMQTFNCFDLVRKELLIHKIDKYNELVNLNKKKNTSITRILKKAFNNFR
ncbi:class I SAM-dependent methyltransferase [Salinimicrobium sediminilitoris]|uniref:class I SAM-dependent methyltransferase n=1 Tax=Salinimicrobium sediminilitoris TaxID=2876715 RepID=UPI001E295570|nr:class I SAM-dependent methyltransferase [Salinimicrobium sediminilitoris]MCC8358513.1 class I SAM-dependent methyltransferase [Salinimicrobium sediminilitoris]